MKSQGVERTTNNRTPKKKEKQSPKPVRGLGANHATSQMSKVLSVIWPSLSWPLAKCSVNSRSLRRVALFASLELFGIGAALVIEKADQNQPQPNDILGSFAFLDSSAYFRPSSHATP